MPRKRKPASVASRFKVYRPPNESKADGKPEAKRFSVYRVDQPNGATLGRAAAPNASQGESDQGQPVRLSRGKRFSVFVPKEPETEKSGGPKGSAWIEHDGLWVCIYGCKSFWLREAPNGVADNDYHAYNCPYWFNEGIDETPF